ncbi:MAG: tRNA pseudouridine(13) synthase TruD [Deltaproteobacteria bacterium]|nr:tRNA pseudouridine(13) synthase TruD [Deltaproteobacteria bacterium]
MQERELPSGRIKASPEDFVVHEIPAYEPSGEGAHLFLHLEKKNLTTDAAVRAVTKALGVEMRDVGIAGMKDKVALTTQWVSLPIPPKQPDIEERAKNLSIDNIRVLVAKRHGNKLKTGHLKGNRFELVVRGIDPAKLDLVKTTLEGFSKDGVPNAFGTQRFGREGDNAERARAWLTGKERPPSDPRLRRFHFSALQSAAFNAVLDARVADGTWALPLEGDLLRKEDTGGIFLCSDVQADRERAARGEVCPTGPIIGAKMRWPDGSVREQEERLVAPFIEGIDLERAKALGEGTRRALRLRVTEMRVEQLLDSASVNPVDENDNREHSGALRVLFVLPKGAYATTVLANALTVVDGSRGSAGSRGHDDEPRAEEE